jgi:enamine deaminase RidA (YjgF/YER057c/UK114 family)
MPVEAITPDGLAEAHGYHHVVRASGERIVCTAGQVGIDESGAVVGEPGDYRAQGFRAILNLHAALRAAGAGPQDVVRTTMYVVNPTEENLKELYRGLGKASREVGAGPTATTLVGVAMLAVEGALFEVDAIAVVD